MTSILRAVPDPVPVLHGARVLLRPPRPSDAQDRLGPQDPEIVRMYGGDATDMHVRSRDEAEAWVAALADHGAAWVVDIAGRCVGSARLDDIDLHDRRARYAVGIDDPALLGQGFGTEVTYLVLGHAFGTLGLHRVSLRVLAYNRRAIRCYEKCGFREEGRERQSALVDGEYHDDVIMGLLAVEYRM